MRTLETQRSFFRGGSEWQHMETFLEKIFENQDGTLSRQRRESRTVSEHGDMIIRRENNKS